MNTEKKIAFGMGVAGLILLGALLFRPPSSPTAPDASLGASQINFASVAIVSTTQLSVGVDKIILATSTGRQQVRIANTGSNTILLSYGTSTMAGDSELLPATTTLTINYDNLYLGAIHASAQQGTASATVWTFLQKH